MKIVAKIDGLPAEVVFANINHALDVSNKAAKMFLEAYKMTGIDKFRSLSQKQIDISRKLLKLIRDNYNLYYIVTKGLGLN